MEYGQGSLTQDPRNGKWLARYRAPDGRQRSKSFKRKSDARTFLSTMAADKERGVWIDPQGAQVPFGKWAEEWLRSQHGLGNASRYRDQGLLRNHVLPVFGSTPLGRISPLDARAWVNDLVASGLSPSTVRLCFRLFAGPMKAAAVARMIPDLPLGRGIINLPPIVPKRERFLTEAEVERLAVAFAEDWRPLIYTAAYTGCRWQELAGLKRCFLDLDRNQLHVRGVTEKDGGVIRWREHPKTEAGRRTIALPAFLAEMLEDHQKSQPLGEMVFTSPKGGLLRETNFRKRFWVPAVQGSGLAPLTFHDLRHTHAAWLIREGVQPLALQRRLGHKDIRTTMNVYGHLFPNHEDGLVVALDQRRAAVRENFSESAKIVRLNAGF